MCNFEGDGKFQNLVEKKSKQCVRYDVSKLLTNCVDVKEKYLTSVMDKAGDR